MEEKKKSLWEQLGRKTEDSAKQKIKEAEEKKKKEKEVANVRGTKIYKDGSRGY